MVSKIEPKLFLLAETKVNQAGVQDFLTHIGAPDFKSDAKSDGELLVELAGRLCYKSFKVGLNPNVTRVREGNMPYIGNILRSGHGSVVEHGTFTIAVCDTTPVVTHELVRHRVGVSPSQVSGRFCRITELAFHMPEAFDHAHSAGIVTSEELAQIEHECNELLTRMERFQGRLGSMFKIDALADFAIKKKLTSAFRRFAPYGMSTSVILTLNHRAARHLIAMRNDTHAEDEVRTVAFTLGHMMKARFPALYQDMHEVEVEQPWGTESVWRFTHAKV